MFEATQNILRLFGVSGRGAGQEDREGGGLRVLGDVDDLLQPGHAQGDVLRRDTGEVEGVEGHLRVERGSQN